MSNAVATPRLDETRAVPTPGKQECGLAWTGNGFWHYDAGSRLLYLLETNGSIVRSLPLEDGGCDTEFDGSSLWQAAPGSLKIYQLNPVTGEILHTLHTKDKCSGLCTDGYNWYRGSWERPEVIRFDPNSGEELESIPTGATTSGLTSDGRYLWHAGEAEGQEFLFCIDPEQGKMIHRQPIDASLCGLTYDGRRLWGACNRRHQLIPIEIE